MHRLSLVAASRGHPLVTVLRLLILVAFLAAEHRLQAHGLQLLWGMGLVALRDVGSFQTRD